MPALPAPCPACRSLFHARFNAETDFIKLLQRLSAMVEAGSLYAVPEAPPLDQPDFPQDHFRCSACGTLWALSHPDQAYRGFCRPQAAP